MYPRETVVAEKFEAMVKLGLANSRMKDFYDIWALSREFDFDGGVLSAAIHATFKRRKTALTPTTPLALTPELSGDPLKQTQWKAFFQRPPEDSGTKHGDPSLTRAGRRIILRV